MSVILVFDLAFYTYCRGTGFARLVKPSQCVLGNERTLGLTRL